MQLLNSASHQTGATTRAQRRAAPAACQRAACNAAAFVAPAAQRRVALRALPSDDDAELEERLKKIRQVKGATPYGEGKTRQRREGKPSGADKAQEPVKSYDFTGETLYWEGAPSKGDLALNVALGATLVWLPLTAAAVGRVAFVKYRFTDRRFSVATTAPWKNEQTDVAYQEVKDVVTVGRGLWGDLVVTLNNGDKVELRSLENFLDLKKYILERRDALSPPASRAAAAAAAAASKAKGVLTQAELLGEPEPAASKGGKGGKGFA